MKNWEKILRSAENMHLRQMHIFGKVKFNINHITYQIIESLKDHFIQ
jgi:hypothetical protein